MLGDLCNIIALRFGDHGTKEILGVLGSKVLPVSNFWQQLPTTCSNMQQNIQMDATCNNDRFVRLHGALRLVLWFSMGQRVKLRLNN